MVGGCVYKLKWQIVSNVNLLKSKLKPSPATAKLYSWIKLNIISLYEQTPILFVPKCGKIHRIKMKSMFSYRVLVFEAKEWSAEYGIESAISWISRYITVIH